MAFDLNAVAPVADYESPPELRRTNFDTFDDWIEANLLHPSFQDLEERLGGRPPESTISARERALLYVLMRQLKAKNTLEIGTYFAGTTQLMAVAAYQDDGKVYTIDPYGADRAPALIAGWPRELADRVVFKPDYSTEFLGPMNNIPDFDIILIDGNHRFPNVIHDLHAAHENLLPGGVIFADNADSLRSWMRAAHLFAKSRTTPQRPFIMPDGRSRIQRQRKGFWTAPFARVSPIPPLL